MCEMKAPRISAPRGGGGRRREPEGNCNSHDSEYYDCGMQECDMWCWFAVGKHCKNKLGDVW
jgi:hypothetical protein